MTFENIGRKAMEQAKAVPSAGGRKHGVTDAVTSPRDTNEIAKWLAGHSPADMDRAAVSRAQQHGVTLEVKYEGRYPSGPNGESLPSYTVATACRIHGNQASRDAAIADLRKFETPAPIRTIEIWLAELSLLTAGRGHQGAEAELALTAYSSRLSGYPADVVKHALTARSWKWFPTWAELEQVCKAKAGPRRHMIAALSQPEPDPEPVRRPPNEGERQRMAYLIAEQFPAVSQAWRDAALEEMTKGNCMAETPKRMGVEG